MATPTGLAAGRDRYDTTRKHGCRAARPPSRHTQPAAQLAERDASKPGVVYVDGITAGLHGTISREGDHVCITEDRADHPITTLVPPSRLSSISSVTDAPRPPALLTSGVPAPRALPRAHPAAVAGRRARLDESVAQAPGTGAR